MDESKAVDVAGGETLAVNMEGVFLGTRQAVRVMKERGGSITKISSVEEIICAPTVAACNASKRARADLYEVRRDLLCTAGMLRPC